MNDKPIPLVTTDMLRDEYRDASLGTTTASPHVKDFILDLKCTKPITMSNSPIQGTTKILVAIIRKISWFKSQSLTFTVETDYEKYSKGFNILKDEYTSALTALKIYNESVGDRDGTIEKLLAMTNMDAVPDLIYYLEHEFTKNVPNWVRFKRVLAILELNIDPSIIDTVKYKYVKYLLGQYSVRKINGIEEDGDQYVTSVVPNEVLHKVMDMYTYAPYSYLFFLHKSIKV